MKLVLGTFARDGIEALWGSDLSAGVRTALRDFAKRERSGRAKRVDWRRVRQLGGAGSDFELSIDGETEEALELKAREHGGITVEELAAHAVLAYLADCDCQPAVSSR